MKLSSSPSPSSASALILAAFAIAIATAATTAAAVTPREQLAAYSAQAGTAADAARGQKLFTSKQGRDWSCSTCHGTVPVGEGKHASTGKLIAPLAPAANAERFTDPAKIEKWFRRNCNDVVGRECSAGEKADVMAWLVSLAK
jgi:cytochrome c peroxidase